MAIDYKSATISNLDTDGQVITPQFDIQKISLYSADGDFKFRMKDESGWGDWIDGFAGIAIDEEFPCSRIQVKAATGSITLSYYLKGVR